MTGWPELERCPKCGRQDVENCGRVGACAFDGSPALSREPSVSELALHYQHAAANAGQQAMRLRFALLILREWALENWNAKAVMVVHDWIDAGMEGPLPWPDDPFFAKWAEEQGWSNVGGFVGFRVVAKTA